MVYRFDYLRLSTESKPTDVVTGSTCYEVDTQKLYIYYKGTWYLQGSDDTSDDEGGDDVQDVQGGDQR